MYMFYWKILRQSFYITQLIVSIAKLEKKFKDIERQNLIQNSLYNPKT